MAGSVIENIDRVFAASEKTGEEDSGRPADEGRDQQHADELQEIERFIVAEISDRIGRVNMTWRKLELCFKWTRLKEYLLRRGLGEDSPHAELLRGLLKARALTSVEYDARSRAILRLNHGDCGYIDDMEEVCAPPSTLEACG